MDDFTIGIWIWDGVEELDFAGPYEVLTAWARMAADERTISVRLVAATTDPITCSHGLRVIPDVALADLGRVDLFLHPGGQVGQLLEDEVFQEHLRERARDTLMTSVCNGALVLRRRDSSRDGPRRRTGAPSRRSRSSARTSMRTRGSSTTARSSPRRESRRGSTWRSTSSSACTARRQPGWCGATSSTSLREVRLLHPELRLDG